MNAAEFPHLEEGEGFATRAGGVTLCRSDQPAVFWVRARGFVARPPLAAALEQARLFGEAHRGGWFYVADLRDSWGFDPRNVSLLRGIHRLPNLRAYVVLAPGAMQRLLLRLGTPVVAPDAIVPTAAEAWELCARG